MSSGSRGERETAYDEDFQVIHHFDQLDLSYITLHYVKLKREVSNVK